MKKLLLSTIAILLVAGAGGYDYYVRHYDLKHGPGATGGRKVVNVDNWIPRYLADEISSISKEGDSVRIVAASEMFYVPSPNWGAPIPAKSFSLRKGGAIMKPERSGAGLGYSGTFIRVKEIRSDGVMLEHGRYSKSGTTLDRDTTWLAYRTAEAKPDKK